MSPVRRRAVLVACCVALVASPASADEAQRSTRARVVLVSGYASMIDSLSNGVENPYGAGLGVRAGVMVWDHLYIGGSYVQYFGWYQRAVDRGGESRYRAAQHMLYGSVELGAEWGVGRFFFMPAIGAGALGSFSRTAVGRAEDVSDTVNPCLYPDALLAARVGPAFLGVDLRLLMTPSRSPSQQQLSWAPSIMLAAGMDR